MNKNKNTKKRALVIVAHPDDETIWMGGFILKHPEYDWTIFSLCRASDTDRAPKFSRVCKFFNARCIMTDLDDEGKLSLKKSILEIKKIIMEKIEKKKFDIIFTHGANGEYGHERHVGTHNAIMALIKEKKIGFKEAFFFNYAKVSKREFAPPIAQKNSDFLLKLNKKEMEKKKSVMTKIYGFAPDGIDTNYCTNPEAFKIIKY